MTDNTIICGILGAREQDLTILSELHRQKNVQVAFIYDPQSEVGLEIAEILGIPRYHNPDELGAVQPLDYLVVSEPQARFAPELETLSATGGKILTPSAAVRLLCSSGPETAPRAQDTEHPYTIEDTLGALEKVLDRQELLKFLLEVAVKATTSQAGSIMLYSAEARELHIAYAIGLSERVIKNTRQKLGEGIAGGVALRQEAQLVRIPAGQSLYARDRERVDIGSAISVPLLWRGRLLGVVNVSTEKREREHDQSDLDRLKTLSRRLARVLYESLRLQELQVRHRESTFRSTVGELAARDLATADKFSVLCRYLAELMGAETVELFLNTREGDWFVLGGSNRLLTPKAERIRMQCGALSRAFLEKRCIVLTENVVSERDPKASISSAVYCHLALKEGAAVAALEFNVRVNLDEFLLVKDAIVLELSRFVSSELRAHRLKRELQSFEKVSDAAATLLGCRSVPDLADVLCRVVADVLECTRVSVRVQPEKGEGTMHISRFSVPRSDDRSWYGDDDKVFERLVRSGKPFAMAFLDFEEEVRTTAGEHDTILASPIVRGETICGGIVAYGKHPVDPMEDAIFSDLDRTILSHLGRLILPVIETVYHGGTAEAATEPDTYHTVLENNRRRIETVCESEISRADRYHHAFSVILFRIQPLAGIFQADAKRAFELVEEITQGIRTRTRKTDYGTWIDPSTYAMVSLETGKRIRFLISRAMVYLLKDLSAAGDVPFERGDVLVGVSGYPGAARSAEALFEQADADLGPYRQE